MAVRVLAGFLAVLGIPAGEDIEAWELSLQRALPDLLTVCDAGGESWRYVGLGLKP